MPIDRDNAAYEHRQLQLLRDILLTVKDGKYVVIK